MPELPEVETFARYFARHALHQRIAKVEVRDERILGEVRRDSFVRKLKGREFEEVRRHGKHLFVSTCHPERSEAPSGVPRRRSFAVSAAQDDTPWLRLHFGMTGDLAYSRDRSGDARFFRVVFHFANGEWLAFEDMRLFGVVDLIESPEAFLATHELGPDPLDPRFTFGKFAALLERRRGAIKSLLMSQDILAGLGNLYVDEILFQTGVHPRRPVHRLKKEEERAIFTTMRRILKEAIKRHERGAELPAKYLFQHREEGERCRRCGGTIRRTVVFGRTTYFCGSHQR